MFLIIGGIALAPFLNTTIAKCNSELICAQNIRSATFLISFSFYVILYALPFGFVLVLIRDHYKLDYKVMLGISLERIVALKSSRGKLDYSELKKHTALLKLSFRAIFNSELYGSITRQIYKNLYDDLNLLYIFIHLASKAEFGTIEVNLTKFSKVSQRKVFNFDLLLTTVSQIKYDLIEKMPSRFKNLNIVIWQRDFEILKIIRYPFVLDIIALLISGAILHALGLG